MLRDDLEKYPLGRWYLSEYNITKPFQCWDYFCPKHKNAKIFETHLNPVMFGIHLKDLAEYSQMSTQVPGFQSFSSFFASFCTGQISHLQHKG